MAPDSDQLLTLREIAYVSVPRAAKMQPISAGERLLSTTEAGQLLGGLHRDDVCRLIRNGELRGKDLIVRGRGHRPRKVVPYSAVLEFMDNLRDSKGRAPVPQKLRQPRQKLSGVIEFV